MIRTLFVVALAALLAAGGASLADSREEKRRREGEKKIAELSKKLERRLQIPEPSEENRFLHRQAASLLERTRQAIGDSYRFDRLARATDALLEASESIFDAREKRNKEDDQREVALELQKDYFRLQQAEYFARQSGEPDAELYVKHARALYQQARRAYDAGEYRKAEELGDASSYIVRALENLAQAAVRIPEPPRL
jgi:hypothetical protein